MRAIGMSTLRDQLQEYVQLAHDGETVLVLESDRVVARLVPPFEDAGAGLEAGGLAEGIRRGWIAPATEAGARTPPLRLPVITWAELAKGLDDDRSDR